MPLVFRQLTPGWTLIKNNLQHGKLELGKFNCEKTTENTGLNVLPILFEDVNVMYSIYVLLICRSVSAARSRALSIDIFLRLREFSSAH